jgi:hypothetical protein
MTHFRSLPTLALATLAILPLGTIACSQGSHSPTEPAPLTESSTLSATSAGSMSVVTAESHGADDTQADDNGGRNGNSGSGKGGGKTPTTPKTPKAPRAGQEFEGAVRSVGAGSLTLANGVKITVNAQTQWIARGDLFSLSQVSASLAARRSPRVEGRGARQSNGSIVAASIKAEDNR